MQLPAKKGSGEELILVSARELADVPADELAGWINQGHAAIKMTVRRLAIHVAQVGAWLVAAKGKCQHGQWLEWLSENCPEVSERTARRYMELYNKAISNRSLMSDLNNMTPMEGYRYLSIVKDPTDKPPVEAPPKRKLKLPSDAPEEWDTFAEYRQWIEDYAFSLLKEDVHYARRIYRSLEILLHQLKETFDELDNLL